MDLLMKKLKNVKDILYIPKLFDFVCELSDFMNIEFSKDKNFNLN